MSKVFLFISSILLIALLSVSCEKKDTSRMIVDGKLEPAEPNESLNDSTLLGVDSNGDGVRDDVERWINRKFPKVADYNHRQLSKQATIEISQFLKPYEGLGKKEFKTIFEDAGRYAKCSSYIFYDLLDNPDAFVDFVVFEKLLREQILNTRKRITHYSGFQSNFHLMHSFVELSRDVKNCDFKPRKGDWVSNEDRPPVESEIPNQIVAGKKGDSDNDGVRDDLELFIYIYQATKDKPVIRTRMYNLVFYYSLMIDTCRENWKTEKCFQKYVEHLKYEQCAWELYNPKLRQKSKFFKILLGISKKMFKNDSDAKLYAEMNNDYQGKVTKRRLLLPDSSETFCQGKIKI